MSTQTAIQRAAYNRWCRRRRQLIAAGQWEPFVDAEPVRQRIRAINQAGMSTSVLTEKLGLPPTALDHVMWKRHGVASALVRRETAEAVMSYWPSLDDFPAYALIDATGTRRRIEALFTLGWTQRYLSGRSGVSERSFSRALAKPRVTADLARKVASLYDELWKRPPYEPEIAAVAAHRMRLHAAAMGYVGPLAWDDDTIDDPSALPQTDADRPEESEGGSVAARWLMGEAVVLGREDRREVLQHLFEWTNLTVEEIAARLDMTQEAAERQWHRIKQKAQADGRRVWRRVYMPRDLRQNEMGEVA
jgi:lambda repressor-like predicted transcriptional regulator